MSSELIAFLQIVGIIEMWRNIDSENVFKVVSYVLSKFEGLVVNILNTCSQNEVLCNFPFIFIWSSSSCNALWLLWDFHCVLIAPSVADMYFNYTVHVLHVHVYTWRQALAIQTQWFHWINTSCALTHQTPFMPDYLFFISSSKLVKCTWPKSYRGRWEFGIVHALRSVRSSIVVWHGCSDYVPPSMVNWTLLIVFNGLTITEYDGESLKKRVADGWSCTCDL